MKSAYEAALHGMQTGVAIKMAVEDPQGVGVGETSAKQLRVGVNSAMVETSALARLLIQKGVCTLEDYEAVLTEVMVEEKDRYERWVRAHTDGAPVRLG